MELIKTLCRSFIERAQALNLKGVKRDDAAVNYFVGAAKALQAIHGDDENVKCLSSWIGLALQFRGYKAITEAVNN